MSTPIPHPIVPHHDDDAFDTILGFTLPITSDGTQLYGQPTCRLSPPQEWAPMKNERMIAWMNECLSHTYSHTYAMLCYTYDMLYRRDFPNVATHKLTDNQDTHELTFREKTNTYEWNQDMTWDSNDHNEWMKVRWSLWMCMYPITLLRDRRLKHNRARNQTRYSTLLQQYRQHERGNT